MRGEPAALTRGERAREGLHDRALAPAIGIGLKLALEIAVRLAGEARIAGVDAALTAHAVAARAKKHHLKQAGRACGDTG